VSIRVVRQTKTGRDRGVPGGGMLLPPAPAQK